MKNPTVEQQKLVAEKLEHGLKKLLDRVGEHMGGFRFTVSGMRPAGSGFQFVCYLHALWDASQIGMIEREPDARVRCHCEEPWLVYYDRVGNCVLFRVGLEKDEPEHAQTRHTRLVLATTGRTSGHCMDCGYKFELGPNGRLS